MKFRAGNKVEVLKRNDFGGSWFPAKVLMMGVCTYTMRYEHLLTTEGERVVEKVHEEDMRPRPPVAHEGERWIVGDVVEVFDLHSWSVGTIIKSLINNYFVIRMFDSIQLRKFHISRLRVWHTWHNNEWVRIGKISEKKHHDSSYDHSSYKNATNLHCGANGAIYRESCTGQRVDQGHEGAISLVQTVKRKLNFHHSLFTHDTVNKASKQRKAISNMGVHQQAKQSLPRNVDAVYFENGIHTSAKAGNIKSGAVDADNENKKYHAIPFKKKKKYHAMLSSSTYLQIVEENNECSVASCSGSCLPEYNTQDTRKYSKEISSSLYDDASSSCPIENGEKCPNRSEEKLAADIHELELNAYQSTMQALYAYGPLSWEHESLLTNLRISLHVSNEEYLRQLRNLLSA